LSYDTPVAGSVGAAEGQLEAILRAAHGLGASDVHLKHEQPPIIRVDGDLQRLEGWDALSRADADRYVEAVCATAPARLSAFMDSGELDSAYQLPDLPRFRVNAFRQRGEISLAFRIIPSAVPTFESLQLPRGVGALAEEHRGIILVTGATGAGKSTTLASMIAYINHTRRQHIVTIEDPIEILHRDDQCIVNQREVGIDTESFNEALRRVLRQDPDVILIGELRDSETAATALQAAESGHLVLTTMHTVDATETVGRFVEFFPAVKQTQVRSIFASVLRGVVSQRLLPRIAGGRIAAVEVLIANNRIRELIRENKTEEIPHAIADGAYFHMQTMVAALIDLVLSGDIDAETAGAAAPNRHDFEIKLGHALKEVSAANAVLDEDVLGCAEEVVELESTEPSEEAAVGEAPPLRLA
jgi:twitching motility protein PilT